MSPQLIRTLRALLFLVAGLVLVTSPFLKLGLTVTNRSCSPAEYADDAFAPYCAATIKTLYPFKSTCAIHVVKQADDIAGGYGIRRFTGPRACAPGGTTVEWRAEAVILTTPDGPVTIAKDDFTGGR